MSTSEKSDPYFELALPDDLVAQEPEALRQKFLVALALQRPLDVDARSVTRVGTAALQLLLALFRDAAARGLAVRLRSSGALNDALGCTALGDDPSIRSALAVADADSSSG